MRQPSPVLIGGKAAMLANAFTAVADDPSAAYLNPGGLPFAREAEVSGSATASQTKFVRYRAVLAGQAVHESSETIYPAQVGGLYRGSTFAIGWNVMTLHAEQTTQADRLVASAEGSAIQEYSRSIQRSEATTVGALGVAAKILPNLSLGAGPILTRHELRAAVLESTTLSDDSQYALGQTLVARNDDLHVNAGLKMQGGGWALGANFRHRLQTLGQTSHAQSHAVSYSDPNGNPSYQRELTDRADVESLRSVQQDDLALGLAWSPSERVTLTADLALLPERSNRLWRYAWGLDLGLGALILRGGMAWFPATVDRPSLDTTNQDPSLDWSTYAAGLGFFVARRYEISLGMAWATGAGKAQLVADSTAVQLVDAESTQALLAIRYRY